MASKQFYQTLKGLLPTGDLTILEMRVAFEKLMSGFPMANDLKIDPVLFKHCKGVIISPPKVASHQIILFFHGGAYSAGSWESHQDLIGRLAKACQMPVCAPDYRLAPEHHIPAATNDAMNAYDYLLAAGYKPEQIIVAGSSAGGGLSISLLQKLKEKPKAGVLMSPWVDLTLSGKTLQTNDGKDLISRARVETAAKAYLVRHDPKDPAISPLFGDLSGLPPLLIQVGTLEILWSEIEALAKKAQAAGTQVTFQPYEGMFHTWQLFASQIPEGQAAIESVASFVTR